MVYKRNVNDLEWTEMGHGERFHFQRKSLTPIKEAYVPKLGMSLFKLKPGKRSFPAHEHLGNDEAILVTSGHGTLRYGSEEIPLRPGDYVHLPAASGRAHQMRNTGSTDLEYYCLSSFVVPEVVVYPDSNKIAAIGPSGVNAAGEPARIAEWFRRDPVQYWDGEDGGE